MNEKELNKLIERYYNGESTGEEEKLLRAYFSSENIPEGYEAEKEIFGYLISATKVPELSSGFESRIFEAIDAADRQNRSQGSRRLLITLLSAAAGILLIAGSYFFFVHSNEPRDTFTDPKLAYAETMKILINVSARMNHGANTLQPVGKMDKLMSKSFGVITKSKTMIGKNLKSLDYLQAGNGSDSVPAEPGK